jgi:acyl-CoA synthetase (AMP-forming)/AMP-acid ligase II
MELLDRLFVHAVDRGNAVALREVGPGGRVLTFDGLCAEIEAFSHRLLTDFPQPCVLMLQMPNVCDFHVAFLSALFAGHAVFPVPMDLAAAELKSAAERANVAAVIAPGIAIHPLRPAAAVLPFSTPSLLLQSSGTTGLPKIVHRSAAAIDAVSHQMAVSVGMGPDDVFLSCVPLCHSYGLEHGLLTPLWAGSTVHLAQGFDLATIRRELTRSGVTVFPAVPSVFEMLAGLGEDERFPSLRLAYSAGGPLPHSVYQTFLDRFGVPIAQLYGATEVGSITFACPQQPNFDPTAVGRAMPGVELSVDAEGQLLVRAGSMLSGYVDAESPVNADGFFPTGDLARLDEHGNLTITGRLKLLIDVGGRKVNPLEVEQTLRQHPGVNECVVVPLKLSDTVYRLKAVITPTRPGAPPTGEELRSFAKDHLSAYKVPRVFEVRESLPRSATGKILRHLLETA